MQFKRIIESTETFPNVTSTTTSEVLDLGNGVQEGSVQVNVTATGVSNAQMLFQVSNDGANWFPSGVPIAITATGTLLQQFTSIPCRYLRVQYSTGAGSLAVTQFNYFRGRQV